MRLGNAASGERESHKQRRSGRTHGSEPTSRELAMGETDVQPIDVAIELPFDLLQTLRLVQAICEAGFRICIDPADEIKVNRLRKVFGLDYKVGARDAARIAGLYVDHMTPVTRIGSIERPLIMPTALLTI